jgi:hypothetical protein
MNRLLIVFLVVLLLSVNVFITYAKDTSDLTAHAASPTDWTVVDERLEQKAQEKSPHLFFPHDFAQHDRAAPDQELTLTVAVEPKNIEDVILSTADASSPNYQRKYTAKEIDEMTANPTGVDAVTQYLTSHGMQVKPTSSNGGYLSVTAPLHVWEKALNTQFYVYKSERNPSNSLIRAKQYSFPAAIAPHVRQVVNAIDFPTPIGGFAATKKQLAIRERATASSKAASSASNEKLMVDPEPSLPPFITLSPDTVIGPIKK